MTDLACAVPPHKPPTTLWRSQKSRARRIPFVGSIAAETLAHALGTRQAARQYDFNMLVACSLADALWPGYPSRLRVAEQEWSAPVDQAVTDLGSTGLAEIPLRSSMSADGVFA